MEYGTISAEDKVAMLKQRIATLEREHLDNTHALADKQARKAAGATASTFTPDGTIDDDIAQLENNLVACDAAHAAVTEELAALA